MIFLIPHTFFDLGKSPNKNGMTVCTLVIGLVSFTDKATIVEYVKANSASTYVQCTIGKPRGSLYTCVYYTHIIYTEAQQPKQRSELDGSSDEKRMVSSTPDRSDYRLTLK